MGRTVYLPIYMNIVDVYCTCRYLNIPYMDAMGLLMVQKSCDHQLMLVVYPIIYDTFFYMPGGDNHQLYQCRFLLGMILLLYGFVFWMCYECCRCLFLLKIRLESKNIFKCWRAMVFYGKQVKFRTTSKKSKDIALCTLLPPKKNRQPTGNSLWPFWDS